MSEGRTGPSPPPGVADAVVESRSRPSIVWLIPLIAALIGGFVAWRAFYERGPAVTIRFTSAEGLEAGKTEVKFKDVTVGLLETVTLEPDLSGVICQARMSKDVEKYLTERSTFWVVKPRIAGGQVSGLGTLLSGSYIGVDLVAEGAHTREFEGLDVPPVVTFKEPGHYFTLRSEHAGKLDVGSPVYFRRIEVGQVVSSELGEKDDTVTTRIFVRAPYDDRVRSDSRFWNASGIDVSLTAQGLRVNTESLVSILIGGIAFDSPSDGAAPVAAADATFSLFDTYADAEARHYERKVPYLLRFNQSVRGLAVGAPVEFRGIQIGSVTDVKLEFDRQSNQFLIPVSIEIEPERFTNIDFGETKRRETLDKLVAAGLRAQLKTGNLLTGQLVVALDIFPNAKPAKVDWSGPIAEVPTIPTPLEEIAANLTQLVERLSKIPVEQIGVDLKDSLASLKVTLKKSEDLGPAVKSTLDQTQKTLASVGPDSTLNAELRRALTEFADAARALGLAADQVQADPQSVLFGKKGSQ